MKKILITIVSFLVTLLTFAQSPNLMNYQGVARNAVGNVLPNQNVALRLTIRDGSATGASVYSETRNVTTNAFGLFNVVVGSPGAVTTSGTIAGINWTPTGTGSKFLQVEIDPVGGTNFVSVGATQLVSVPYALGAAGAAPVGPAGGDLAGSTYPNPIIAPLVVTTGKLADGAVTTIKIADGAVTSQKITFPLIKSQAEAANPLVGMTNSSTTGTLGAITGTSASTDGSANAITGTISSTSPGGFSTGVRGINNSTTGNGIGVFGSQNGSGWGVYGNTPSGIGVHGYSDNGLGVAGYSNVNGRAAEFAIQNATNTNTAVTVRTNGLGRAGLFTSTNAASTANGVDVNVAGTGFALRAASTNAAPKALQTVGGLQLTGIGEAANRVLVSDATGNATWQALGGAGGVTGSGTLNFIPKWTPTGTNIGNSLLFDDGNSIGLGTTTPTHRFDVTHSGSTGIGVNSTSGFSVVDINAASGDAALRFAKAGVNQWNIRNRPADDYLEIFELGGGGSRMVIQDATGNVGIGETTSPSYKLDVLHGGATGIRSRSSSSFSVVDIDAASGDAALRFAKAGVNQWNTRNRPADDYYEIFELGGGGSRFVIQDGTGNVGIGETTSPSYKLDVLHGGSTGIRSRSSSSFSVVDIDAQSGDAALRFAKAGVNQWNVRNRPADDYFEIFELGGGGSRVVIQDATGNVGIGETTAPSYKLDVLHGGSTGIRSRSSSSFSVVDIDGQSGDAALRFAKAGVNQWNTRNNPGTDDYQIFELGGGGERMRIENTTGRVVVNGDFTVVGAKAFTMDHPLDPTNKLLRHAAAESNEVINFYSGNITTDAAGKATVQLPDYFEAINKDFRYQLTVIGSFAQAIVSKEVANNKFEIATNQPNIKVSWEVKGVRNDAHMRKFPFQAVEEKSTLQKGKYWDPASHNQPESMRISYTPTNGGSSLDDVTPQVATKKIVPSSGGSLDQAPIVAPSKAKAIDNTGSVSNEVKKEDKKPIVKSTEKGSVD
ncbi:MAG: hypothetical protein KA319_04760 [Ferruginibacter sp.]|nr:hypothetical protein [Ferruginibacter sp.]